MVTKWTPILRVLRANDKILTLLIAFLAAGFGGWTAYEAHQSTEEARKNSSDSVASTQLQMDQMKFQLEEMRKLVEAETTLAAAANSSLFATERIASVTQRGLLDSEKAFEVEHRPWLVVRKATVTEDGSVTTLIIDIQNIGHSPAHQLFVSGITEEGFYRSNPSIRELKAMRRDQPVGQQTPFEALNAPGYGNDQVMSSNLPVSLGASTEFRVNVGHVPTNDQGDLKVRHQFRFKGLLGYCDLNGTRYETPVCLDISGGDIAPGSFCRNTRTVHTAKHQKPARRIGNTKPQFGPA
jgi:hypothetical protein